MLGLTVQHEAQARLVQQIEEAEYAAALALEEACRREQAARDHLDQIRRNATRTEDGRTVYLTADGKRAFDDDGNELTPADIAGINWRDGAPTWEQRQAAAARVERTVQDRQEIEAYQERLQQGRGRLENGQPVTADESDSIRRDIEAMPDSVRRHLGTLRRPGASAASHYEGQGIEARPATPAFTRAAIGPGEIAAIRETPAPAPESLDI